MSKAPVRSYLQVAYVMESFLRGYVYLANQHGYALLVASPFSLSLSLPVSFSLSLSLYLSLSLSLSFSLVFLGTLLRHSQTQVHIVRWWMKHYGSRTSKRHMGFANSPAIRRLDLGRLQVSKGPAPKTCVKYHDRQGRLKYKGTKHLKATEILC